MPQKPLDSVGERRNLPAQRVKLAENQGCRSSYDEAQGNGNNCAWTHAATQFMRIAANAIWGDTNQAQQFDSTLSSRICSHRWPMRTQHICDLSTDIEYGIERIHSTLENNSQFAPTKGTQLRSRKLKNIHRLRNINCSLFTFIPSSLPP